MLGVLFAPEPEEVAFLVVLLEMAVAVFLATAFLLVGLGVEARLFSKADGVTARRLLPAAVTGRLSRLAPPATTVEGAEAD